MRPSMLKASLLSNRCQMSKPRSSRMSHLSSSFKNCRESMGQIGSRISGRDRALSWGTVGHESWRVGSQGVLIAWQEGSSRQAPFLLRAFPQAGIARPLPPEPTGRLRSWRRTRWPTESPRQHPGARAGPLRGRRTSRPIPFAWQWPAARPAPACRRKASGRRPSQP